LAGETNSPIARAPRPDYCDKAAVGFTNAAGGALDDASNKSEFRFTVSYSDQELRTYGKVMAGRYARAQTEATAFGILLAAILILGLAVFGAIKFGLVAPSAVRPVLLTAYFSFTTGVAGYYFVMRGYFRKLIRTDQRGGTWNYSFEPAGIFYNSEFIEVRLAWRAVHAVEDLGKMVIFRFGAQGIAIPSRVFSSDAARAAFLAAATKRIKTAAEKA
jgi:hypothetical protein